jgi:hypothetical protein
MRGVDTLRTEGSAGAASGGVDLWRAATTRSRSSGMVGGGRGGGGGAWEMGTWRIGPIGCRRGAGDTKREEEAGHSGAPGNWRRGDGLGGATTSMGGGVARLFPEIYTSRA